MCTPLFSGGGGGWISYQIFKKGGTWQDLNFESRVAGKEGVTFSGGGGVQFLQKKQTN